MLSVEYYKGAFFTPCFRFQSLRNYCSITLPPMRFIFAFSFLKIPEAFRFQIALSILRYSSNNGFIFMQRCSVRGTFSSIIWLTKARYQSIYFETLSWLVDDEWYTGIVKQKWLCAPLSLWIFHGVFDDNLFKTSHDIADRQINVINTPWQHTHEFPDTYKQLLMTMFA